MKIECLHCNQIYNAQLGSCTSCGKTGGFMAEPSLKDTTIGTINRNDLLQHIESSNIYKIKEFQANGFIVYLESDKIGLTEKTNNMKMYISANDIEQYQRI